MSLKQILNFRALTALVPVLAFVPGVWSAEQSVRAGADSLEGVVTGPNGPEAGVWVIAETTDLPTRFVKMVVTDVRGQ